MENINDIELRPEHVDKGVSIITLAEAVYTLIDEVRELKEMIRRESDNTDCRAVESIEFQHSPWLFVSIIELAKDGSISAKVASSLDAAGIKYISDFQYVTLNELSKIRTFKDNEFSDLLQLLDERFNVQISNSRTICPMFTVGDLVRFVPNGSTSIPHDETLRILSIDHSPLLPKYTCSVMDGSRKFVLSPSVLTSWNR